MQRAADILCCTIHEGKLGSITPVVRLVTRITVHNITIYYKLATTIITMVPMRNTTGELIIKSTLTFCVAQHTVFTFWKSLQSNWYTLTRNWVQAVGQSVLKCAGNRIQSVCAIASKLPHCDAPSHLLPRLCQRTVATTTSGYPVAWMLGAKVRTPGMRGVCGHGACHRHHRGSRGAGMPTGLL